MKRLVFLHIMVLACMTTVYAMEKMEIEDNSGSLEINRPRTNSSFHTAGINCLYHKNPHLFSASEDGTVKIWKENEKLKEIPNDSYFKLLPADLIDLIRYYMEVKFICVDTLKHDHPVTALLLDGDGLLFSGDQKGRIYICQKSGDTKNYQCIGHLTDHEATYIDINGCPQKKSNSITGLVKYEDKLISGSYDKTIKIWEKTDPQDPQTFTCRSTVSDFPCRLSLIENFVISFSADWNGTNVWEIAKNETKLTKKGVLPIKIGRYVDSSDIIFDLYGNSIQVWQKQNNDVMSYKCIAELKLEESAMLYYFASSKMAIFVGENRGKIGIWQKTNPEDPKTFAYVTKLDNKERVCALASDQSGTLFVGGRDGSLKIWRPSDHSNPKTYECICVLGREKPEPELVASGITDNISSDEIFTSGDLVLY